MANTQDFRTQTIIKQAINPSYGGKWGIAVDIGYSGTKIFSPNTIATFPSFAVKLNDMRIEFNSPNNNDILYRENESSPAWLVGKEAQNMLSADDADNSSMAIYGRKRYFSPMFLVIARTAIAIAYRKNDCGNPEDREIVLQTGLPNKYLKSDNEFIKEVIAGHHEFDIKIGSKNWEHFNFDLPPENIYIMPQPMGTFLSVITNDDGDTINEAGEYIKSSTLVVDPGFGTMDCFSIRNKSMIEDEIETFDSYSMKEVLRRTSNEINRRYHVDIPVPIMQKYLETGKVTTYNRKTNTGSVEDFTEILIQKNEEVAKEAIDKIKETYDYLLEYQYLIITGGTGEAWYPYFEEAFSNVPELTIVPGNNTNDLPYLFSNVRGYYMFLQSKLNS